MKSRLAATPGKKLTMNEAENLADFILFSHRNCLLHLSPLLNEGKVSYAQFFLLAYLAEEECLSMTSIAHLMGRSTAASTGMVDKLQTLGYLKRVTAASDRRKIMVRITPQGQELIERMRGNIARDLAQMMADTESSPNLEQAQQVIIRRHKNQR